MHSRPSGVMAAFADPQFPYGLIRKFFINGVANLLAIVGDCNCNGLLAHHRARMELLYDEFTAVLKAGRCNLKPVEARVESAWFQLLKLKYDELLSNSAFEFNSRRYMAVPHSDAFGMLPAGFHDVVFTGLASYGEHFPSTKVRPRPRGHCSEHQAGGVSTRETEGCRRMW